VNQTLQSEPFLTPWNTLPLLIPLTDVPRLMSVSRAHLARMRAAGRFAVTVLHSGRKLLVRRDELERWIAAGMPDTALWRPMEHRRLRVS
jgi:hypothetical protein